MSVDIVKDSRLIQTVEESLRDNPAIKYLQTVLEILKPLQFYLMGGAVRDALARKKYGLDLVTRDFDFLVIDEKGQVDLWGLFSNFHNMRCNRFGGLKWKPKKGVEFDLFTSYSFGRTSLNEVLEDVELTTSAIAFHFGERLIYSCGAIQGIEDKEIDVKNPQADKPYITMSRLILHSDKLGFRIGNRGIRFVQERYNSNLDGFILDYLTYKKLEEHYERVIKRLKEIKAQ